MIPIKVCIEGFLSYRDRAEFNFDGAPLWILTGDNGAGKSSVFEAINYVLYGSCRDNKISLEEIINTNSNLMVVEFDFSVDGRIYRVKRTCQRRKNSTASTFQAFEFLSEYKEENLEIIPGTDKNKGFQEWVIKTIGLEEKAFNSSIYLRQGNADALLKKLPSERHQILEQIVDLSKYKTLEERAKNYHDYYKGKIISCERTYEYYNAELEKLLPVSQLDIQNLTENDIQTLVEDSIHTLSTELESISKELDSINNTLEQKIELKIYAARWEKLNQDKKTIQNNLGQFNQLINQEAQIKTNVERSEDLKLHIPILGDLFLSRKRIEFLNGKLADQGSVNEQIKGLKTLLQEIESIRSELPHWQRYKEERGKWQALKAEIVDLVSQVNKITDKITDTETEFADKSNRLAKAEESNSNAFKKYQHTEFELKETKNKKDRFSKLEGKAECDSCGQPLTEEHRMRESAKIAEMLAGNEKRNFEAKKDYEICFKDFETLKKENENAQKQLESLRSEKQRNTDSLENATKRKFDAQDNASTSLSSIMDSAERLFGSIENIEFCFNQAYPSNTDLEGMKKRSEIYLRQKSELDELDRIQKEMSGFEIEINLLQPKVDKQILILPENWRRETDDLTKIRLNELQNEKASLSEAPLMFAELQKALSEKTAQERRFQEINEELENTTESARRETSTIDKEIAQSRQEKIKVEENKNTAVAKKSELKTQQLRRAELEKEQKEVRHKAALYRELSSLLGRDALQRWLLRGAEETIVYNANNFLERISNRSIELKLKTSISDEGNIEAGTKALDLMANYQIEEGNYALLPVDSLSGGQRFRVAVSLALGIGQYANTGTRKLESVIIDEGFGSLDVDGRNEMIDEIKALKDILQRIIIVSHQEEVSKAFTNNKYLIENTNGTSSVRLIDEFE